MKKKLILATNNFPYNTGEKAFILPELKRLRAKYDIVVISHADEEQRKLGYVEQNLLEGMRVLCFPRPVIHVRDKVKAFFSYMGSSDGRQEIREIIGARCNIPMRLYQSLAFYAQAMADQKEIRESGILEKNVPIIYYSFWNTYYCYSMVREKKRYQNLKIISRLHGFDLYHDRVPGGRQPMKHQMEAGADSLVFLGGFAEKYYREQIQKGITQGTKLYVCPLGTEAPARRMPPKQGMEWQLLSCSDVIPLKRVERIVDGLAAVTGEAIHWTHIGGGSELDKLKEYAERKLSQKNNIKYTFAGQMTHEEVIRYYETEQVDCFITTSSTEGIPMSIMEAMSYSIPVIATSVGGIPEMIQGNGILLSANPEGEEVAAALTEMCGKDIEVMLAWKNKSYELWEQRFAIETTAHSLIDLIES